MEDQKLQIHGAVPALVIGATGKQGGAVARALLRRGIPVRALVRDTSSAKSQTLSALGLKLIQGNLDDIETLRPACNAVRAVFSVQMPDMSDLLGNAEKMQAHNLVEAAKEAGVPHFVHSSVSGTKEHRNAPGWREGRWHKTHIAHYWESKAEIEDLVRAAAFPGWTILRPSFFMENFIRPSFLFANSTEDRLLTVIKPETRIALVAVADIGVAAAAAIADPQRFREVELELAGDWLSMKQIASVLSDAMRVQLSAPELTADEAIAQGMMPVLVVGQEGRTKCQLLQGLNSPTPWDC